MPLNKIAIIVGAGAVENAWTPVLKALKTATGLDMDSDCANYLFARYIYLQRFYSKMPLPDAKLYLKLSNENSNLLKRQICNELKQAQDNGSVKPQKEFRKILTRFINPGQIPDLE